jgi:hypothetical protein
MDGVRQVKDDAALFKYGEAGKTGRSSIAGG